MDFQGKKVLVTGGGRGIGRACAQGFSERGAVVAVNYRQNEAAALETVHSLAGEGHIAVQADVSVPAETERLVAETVERLGGLDIVVNNAGGGGRHPIDQVGFDEWLAAWDRILDTNLRGPANVMYWAVQHMLQRGGGRIVNVSSRGAFRGEPEQPAYGASKAGLNALSQSLAQKLAPMNIFVGVVAPGFVETGLVAERLAGPEGDGIRSQSPLGRVAMPEEVAYAVLFLASEEARFSTGAIIDVNGASYLRS